MSGDFVSRDWLLAEYDRQHQGPPGGARRIIAEAPAADVVEVVRCRDCVYWRGENDICKGICIDFSADGYCSEGKRKDGGQEA